MIFVISEDDKGNPIVHKVSNSGKSDCLIFLIEGVQPSIRAIAMAVTKVVKAVCYISRQVPYHDAAEEYTNLLTEPSESLDDFKKIMKSLGIEIKKNNGALSIPKRKSKDRIMIQTRQQGGILKYKRYELRIYSRLLEVK